MANNQLGIRLFGKGSSVLCWGSFMLLRCVADHGRVMVIEPLWANDIISLLCVSVCRTHVGVIAPVAAEILVSALSDRVGGSVGRSEWLLLVSRWVWGFSRASWNGIVRKGA